MRTHFRRPLVVVLAVALSSTALGGPANGKGKPRRVTMSALYTGPGAAAGRGIITVWNGDTDTRVGGALFHPPGTFTRVAVHVADDHAPDVAFVIGQDVDDNGFLDRETAGCSATAEPLEVAPGAPVGVFVQAGPCSDGTVASATTGRIRITFVP